MKQDDDSFWLGWEAFGEAMSAALSVLFALDDSRCKSIDALLDVQNSISELLSIREKTIADLTRVP